MVMCCKATFLVFLAICSCTASSTRALLPGTHTWLAQHESAGIRIRGPTCTGANRRLSSEAESAQEHDSKAGNSGREDEQQLLSGTLNSHSSWLSSSHLAASRLLLQSSVHIQRNTEGRKEGAGRRTWPSRQSGMKTSRAWSKANGADTEGDGNAQHEGGDEKTLEVETLEQLQEATNNQDKHWSLLSFELVMLGLLGLALPVVYWRKMRIRHL